MALLLKRVLWLLLALGCGGSPRGADGQLGHDPATWTAENRAMCGEDPAKRSDLEDGEWLPQLGCLRVDSVVRRCSETDGGRLYRPMYCAGEPMSAECGNREEAYLAARKLLPCVCMTEEQYEIELDYCENAPSQPAF